MPCPTRGGEFLEQFSAPDRAMPIDDLHQHIDVLMNNESPLSSRTELLFTLASACGSSTTNLRFFTKALVRSLTARWTCWEEQRYTGIEALEWRTCILQAAGNAVVAVKDVTETFVLLGVKASTWCTDVVSANLQGRISERELPAGGLSKIQTAAVKIVTSVVEGIVEKYSPTEPQLPEAPLASVIENLTSSSFALVKVVYLCSLNHPSPQPSDSDSMRKRCHELLSLTFRLVYTFRRHIGSHPPRGIGFTQTEKREDLKSPERWQQEATSLRIVASSIKSLAELGDLSTKGGAISLGLLNVSWKSVAALLQMEDGRDILASAVDIKLILTSLLHHALEALKPPIKSWFSCPSLGEKDARRLCIPVKFFLQMAEKVSSFYPQQAIMASTSIVISVSKVLASLLLQFRDGHVLSTGLHVLAELVIPSAVRIMHNLLSSRSIEDEAKVQLLQLITCDSDDLWSFHSITDLDAGHEYSEVLDELFNDKPNSLGLLKTGRLALFVSLLQLSSQYCINLQSQLTVKLHWLLEALLEPGVYILLTQRRLLPVWSADLKVNWKYHLMFTWMSNALQTFAGVAAKDDSIWTELQHFLFENVLHPRALCREIVLNLWCFIIRKSDSGSAQRHIELLFSLLKDMVSAKVDVTVQRRLARILCILLEEIPGAEAARVYTSVFHQDPFSNERTANLTTVLLEEGNSSTLISDRTWNASIDRFLSACIAGGKGLVECLKQDRSSSNFASQKQALTCLQLLLCESAFRREEIEAKYLQEILAIVQELLSKTIQEGMRSPTFQGDEILSLSLQLIPHVQHLLDASFIPALLPKLHECCRLIAQDTSGKELKQTLPEFLANLSEIAMTEEEENPAMGALWGLYHLIFKEKHWALVHMGLASFSHFATHTSCQELWRFVPQDAALALKINNDNTDDVFMSALKCFIEKEGSQTCLALSDEEVELLRDEGALLQKYRHGVNGSASYSNVEDMDMGLVSVYTADIEQALDLIRENIEILGERLRSLLAANCSSSQNFQVIRSRLADLKEEVGALQLE